MPIERKIFINQCLIGILGVGFVCLGMWLRHQQDQINELNSLLHLSLKELSNLTIGG